MNGINKMLDGLPVGYKHYSVLRISKGSSGRKK